MKLSDLAEITTAIEKNNIAELLATVVETQSCLERGLRACADAVEALPGLIKEISSTTEQEEVADSIISRVIHTLNLINDARLEREMLMTGMTLLGHDREDLENHVEELMRAQGLR